MRFNQKNFEIPQVCLDLGFEDKSHHNEQSARMYNPQLDLTLWVNELCSPKKHYILQECDDGELGEVETDDELRELVASVRTLKLSGAWKVEKWIEGRRRPETGSLRGIYVTSSKVTER